MIGSMTPYELDRAELFATQNLLKALILLVVSKSPTQLEDEALLAGIVERATLNFRFGGGTDEKTDEMREYMLDLAHRLLAEALPKTTG